MRLAGRCKSYVSPRRGMAPLTSFGRAVFSLWVRPCCGFRTPAVFRISPLAVSPLTRCLQAISDTKVDRRILPANEPDNYFPAALRVKKLTPALPGHPEVIFSKIIVRTLVVPVYRY